MKKIKSLLIAKDIPSSGYGTGQRLLSIKTALEKLGECRVLWLTNQNQDNVPDGVSYIVPSGISNHPSKMDWILRNLLFSDYRPYFPAIKAVEKIRNTYPFDVVFCNFFGATVAAPHHLVPCILDVDCLPMPQSRLTKIIWFLTRYMMNRCALKFQQVFIIRPSDRLILNRNKTIWLPCISNSATTPVNVNPEAKNILFVGSPAWKPNRDAIQFLIKQILPHLQTINPTLKLRLVGRGTEVYSGIPGVDALGFVDDIVQEYGHWVLEG